MDTTLSYDEILLGDLLRGERATLGKSLLDVERELRIKARYLAAIEDCDPSIIDNKSFVSGYVRSYARYLGLDPEAMLDKFRRESGFKLESYTKPSDFRRSADASYDYVRKSRWYESISFSSVASTAVLLALICGLLYSGWLFLQNIQRVNFAPSEQTPEVTAELSAPDVTSPEAEDELKLSSLERLYKPQELKVPQLAPRDGRIASLDPQESGYFRTVAQTETPVEVTPAVATVNPTPIVTEDITPPNVQIVAIRPAWVRVYLPDGSVLLEKILEVGERYSVPLDVENPLLRAGNSGSVYLVIEEVAYGPAGRGTGVAKQISLLPDDVVERFEAAEGVLEDLPQPEGPGLPSGDAGTKVAQD
ncbi:helix-turn-helix domain-containing protein [Paracoccaceae bacterium GXU_MW_L88]